MNIKEDSFMEYETLDVIQKIQDWFYKKDSKLLNIVTYPFNETFIFDSIIRDVSMSGENILYMCGKSKREEMQKLFNHNGSYKTISECDSNTIKIVDINELLNINDKYKLIIIDDISSLSDLSKLELAEHVDYLYNKCDKMIVYSYVRIMENVDCFFAGSFMRNKPYVEPRIIRTRINLSSDIPYIAYDYMKMFKRNRRNLFIFAPDEEKKKVLYDYLVDSLEFSKKAKVINHFKDDDIDEVILESKEIPVIIVSCNMYHDLRRIPNMDVMIYYSDNNLFNHKNIVYICGQVGYREKEGEVLLLSNNVTYNMEKAKNCTRKYNEILWKKGLIL